MTKNNNRDDFTKSTKNRLARDARYCCSNPSCRKITSAPTRDGANEINIGVAAHISAAAPGPGAKRYNPIMTSEERKSHSNGIWLCQDCAKVIDSDELSFPEDLLYAWKKQHQEDLWRCVVEKINFSAALPPTSGELTVRMKRAVVEDLEAHRRSKRWPQSNVSLRLEVEGKDAGGVVEADSLGGSLHAAGDLIIAAPPGSGKTSVLFQLAEAAVAADVAMPIFLSLPDWASSHVSIIEAILRRPAFSELTKSEFWSVAEQPGIVFMLDSWNELDAAGRRRARAEILELRDQFPAIAFVSTTRPRLSDLPIDGQTLKVSELDEGQQIRIARELCGEEGELLVDKALRTHGVRDLISNPLYLTALLSLPKGEPFPETKEELLRRFVQIHENQPQHMEALGEMTQGLQAEFLCGIAGKAMQLRTTSMEEGEVRKAISDTSEKLVVDGQIARKAEPRAVLEALTNHHILVRSDDLERYHFQHHQFQEWYASKLAEALIIEAFTDQTAQLSLTRDVLNNRRWEEPILFAVERISRGGEQQQQACAQSILTALTIDPMLAAEMIYRATDTVWQRVARTVREFVQEWHVSGVLDRAVRFMVLSGRREFRDIVWSFISSENRNIRLSALRVSHVFRPSVLGEESEKDIESLPVELRSSIASEIAIGGGIDGLQLANSIAMVDEELSVKRSVASSLMFRHAWRQLRDLLSTVDDDCLGEVIDESIFHLIDDNEIKNRINNYQIKNKQYRSLRQLLNSMVHGKFDKRHRYDLREILSDSSFVFYEGVVYDLWELFPTYKEDIRSGLTQRMMSGGELFPDAWKFTSASGVILENETFLEIITSSDESKDFAANVAASMLGPVSCGKLIDKFLSLLSIDKKGQETNNNRCRYLRSKLAIVPKKSLLIAVQERAKTVEVQNISELAELLRYHGGETEAANIFPEGTELIVSKIVRDWVEKLIASDISRKRWHFSSLVNLIASFPSVQQLPALEALLREELAMRYDFRKQAIAERWRGSAADEARTSHEISYRKAFIAIRSAKTKALMIDYLSDEYFGESAAIVLKVHWLLMHDGIVEDRRFSGSVSFANVGELRGSHTKPRQTTCEEAEAMFAAIETAYFNKKTDWMRKHAIKLAVHAVRLPHTRYGDLIEAILAEAPQVDRSQIILNMVLSGDNVNASVIKKGIDDFFLDVSDRPWILDDGWQLKEWLRLLPFVADPLEIADVFSKLPVEQQRPRFVEEMLMATEFVQSPDIEDFLFKIAEINPDFYKDYIWCKAVKRRQTASVARRFIDLIVAGNIPSSGRSYQSEDIVKFLDDHVDVREYVYKILESGSWPAIKPLVLAVAMTSSPEGLLLLVSLESRLKVGLISSRTVQNVVSAKIPIGDRGDVFELQPVEMTQLRSELLRMTKNGGEGAIVAKRTLEKIDQVRDEYGVPEDEPRHPDLASGICWPSLSVCEAIATR